MHSAQRLVWLNALAHRPGGSGVQTYIRELIAALDATADVRLIAAVQPDVIEELPPRVSVSPRRRSDGMKRALEGLRTADPDVDVVHGLDVDLPLRRTAPSVTTVHDMSVFDVPWAHSRARAVAERALIRRALRVADSVIAVSDFTAERVKVISGRECSVTPLAPARWATPAAPEAIEAVRAKYGLPERCVLQVASVEPRKQVDLLVDAGSQAGIPVVLAGAGSAQRSVPGSVLGLGYVDQEDLPALYGAATVVSYLSAYEGFGLPPLEAMASGGCVLSSATGPMIDVLGSAALLVPNRVEDVSTALRQLAADQDLRAELRAAGLRRAAEFTWAKTAAATNDVYRNLSGAGS